MTITGIQLLVIPFALFLIYVAYIHYKKGYILRENYFFWLTLWISFIIISLFPQLFNPIVKNFNFFRLLDLLMILSFMILVLLTYNNYLISQKNNRKLQELIEKLTTIRSPIKKVKPRRR